MVSLFHVPSLRIYNIMGEKGEGDRETSRGEEWFSSTHVFKFTTCVKEVMDGLAFAMSSQFVRLESGSHVASWRVQLLHFTRQWTQEGCCHLFKVVSTSYSHSPPLGRGLSLAPYVILVDATTFFPRLLEVITMGVMRSGIILGKGKSEWMEADHNSRKQSVWHVFEFTALLHVNSSMGSSSCQLNCEGLMGLQSISFSVWFTLFVWPFVCGWNVIEA